MDPVCAAVYEDVKKIIAHWDSGNAPKGAYKAYSSAYREPQNFENVFNFYKSFTEFLPDVEGTEGCDLGCWLGFPAMFEAKAGNCFVHGVDIQKDFEIVNKDWASLIGLENVAFSTIHDGRVPLQNDSIDWVLINQVLCNALSGTFDQTVSEAFRILKPGGVLVIGDSNNPYCDAVGERLLATYNRAEAYDPKSDDQPGYNVKARMAVIGEFDRQARDGQGHVSLLSDEERLQLALHTCYMAGDDLKAAYLDYKLNGRMPTSVYSEGLEMTPLNPRNGAALGNVTNPFTLTDIATQKGFDAYPHTALSWDRLSNEELYSRYGNSGSFVVVAKKPEA